VKALACVRWYNKKHYFDVLDLQPVSDEPGAEVPVSGEPGAEVAVPQAGAKA
jgi:hypothetical protein